MDKRTLEAVRYLGYGKHAVDDQTLALIRDSFEDLERVAKRRIVYRIFELKVSDEEHLNIEGLEITSRNLAKNMKGCTQVVMLGATLGVEVDMLMKRYSLTEMSRTVVLQACAAAMLHQNSTFSHKADRIDRLQPAGHRDGCVFAKAQSRCNIWFYSTFHQNFCHGKSCCYHGRLCIFCLV